MGPVEGCGGGGVGDEGSEVLNFDVLEQLHNSVVVSE